MTAATLDTRILVDDRLFDVVHVEVAPARDAGQGPAHHVLYAGVPLLIHEIRQAVAEVFDDPESIDHGGRADLNGAAAHGNELGGVAPGGNSANARDGQASCLHVARDLGHHVQGNGLHGRAAVAAMRTLFAHA